MTRRDGACCSLGSVLEGTLIAQLANCYRTIWPLLGKRMSKGQQKATFLTMLGQKGNLDQSKRNQGAEHGGLSREPNLTGREEETGHEVD